MALQYDTRDDDRMGGGTSAYCSPRLLTAKSNRTAGEEAVLCTTK
ncbi:MAG: hypothetical protein AB7H48_02680 [Parachlamydiales bacterium]